MSTDKVKISIPESYADVELHTLQKLKALEGNDEHVGIQTIRLLTGLRTDEIRRMKLFDRDMIITQLEKAFKEQDSKLTRTFKLDGIEYGFIPDLDDMTTGEFLDLEFLKYGYDEFDWSNLHKVMSIFYRPIVKLHNKLYSIEPYSGIEKHSEALKYMPSDIAIGVEVFFYNIVNKLLIATLKSLQEEVQKQIKKRNLPKNGDGTQALINSLKRTLQDTNPLNSFQLINSLPRLRTTLIDQN